MNRYKMIVAYRGTHYHGWQRQLAARTWKGATPKPGHGIPTIQETLARAIGLVVGHPVIICGSSRTDAGVHAKGQLAHFDTDQTQIPLEGLRRSVNHQLPDDILIRTIEPAEAGFNAIGSTASKRYQYFVWTGLERNPFIPELCWHRWQELDVAGMREAAKYFVGEKDFKSYCRPGHGRATTVREVLDCSVSLVGMKLVIGIEGTGFLWNMVRIMVGTLVEVGLGKFKPEDIPITLAALDRRAAGTTAPPHGLYLQWVKTRAEPADDEIDAEAEMS